MKLLMIFIGYGLGINFPDIDHKIKFLGHRSFFTHSPIITYILYYLGKINGLNDFNYILIGFSFAVGIHLIFDLFPKKWTGGSIIKPFGGIMFSKIYIFLGALLSFLFSARVAKDMNEYLLLSLMGLSAIFIYSKKERTLVRPFFSYIVIVFLLGTFLFEGFINNMMKYFQIFLTLLKV